MKRTRQQWAAVCPRTVAETASPAAVMYLLRDALADIEALHAQATQDQPERSKAIEQAKQQITGFISGQRYGARELIHGMGLSAEEWQQIKAECQWIPQSVSADFDAALAANGGRP